MINKKRNDENIHFLIISAQFNITLNTFLVRLLLPAFILLNNICFSQKKKWFRLLE